MAKRVRGSTRPGQRRPIARRPATARRRPARRRPRPPRKPAGPHRRRAQARRGARGAAGRRGAGRRDRPPPVAGAQRQRPRAGVRHGRARSTTRGVRLRRARPQGHPPDRDPAAGRPVRRCTSRSTSPGCSRSPDPARATIAPCPPGAPSPAPAPNPCSGRRPSGSRSPPGCARARSRSSSARATSSATAVRCAARSPAATSRACCCGARPAPARRRSPACSPTPSAPSSGPCPRSCPASPRSAAAIAEAQDRLALEAPPHRPVHRRDPPLQQVPAGRAPAARRGRHGHARSARRPRTRTSRSTPRSCRGCASGASSRSPTTTSRTIVRRALEDEERGVAGSFGPDGRRRRWPPTPSTTSSTSRAATRARRSTCSRARSRWPRTRTIGRREGAVSPTLADVEAAAQQRVLAYDRAGDGHYDTVSAFIKSLRGNDADAALYWLAAMIAAGEDPRFIVRRLIISASEDVGNADPRALQVAVAAAQALDHIGLPEAQYALAQATAYIATAPKSDRSGAAYSRRWPTSTRVGSLPVPNPPPQRRRPADEAPRHRRRLSIPPRLRGRRRRAAVPARRARRPALLPARRPGLRGDDRDPDGRPRRGPAASRRGASSAPTPRWRSMGDGVEGQHGEPQEARARRRSGTPATRADGRGSAFASPEVATTFRDPRSGR